MKKLYLNFGQYQGAGDHIQLYNSAQDIFNRLENSNDFINISIDRDFEPQIKNEIFAYDVIEQQLSDAIDILKREAPDNIFTLGGDCGVELAPVSYLNQRYNGDLAVIWFDAHADLNTPHTSPSKEFHGMPLRHLLGDGEIELINMQFSCLKPKQVFLAAVREIDGAEQEYIDENNIKNISVNDLHNELEKLVQLIKTAGYKHVYIHVDLDGLDPVEFPYTLFPTPEGASIGGLIAMIDILKQNFKVVGSSVTEYCTQNKADDGLDMVTDIIRHLTK